MSGTPRLEQRPAIEIAREIVAVTDIDERRIVRLGYREQVAEYRLQARQLQGFAKLADAFAKLGGGSLLTATLLLIINGRAPLSVAVTAVPGLAPVFGLHYLVGRVGAARGETRCNGRTFGSGVEGSRAMNIDTDLVLAIAWIILGFWAAGLAALIVMYRRSERAFERYMERYRR